MHTNTWALTNAQVLSSANGHTTTLQVVHCSWAAIQLSSLQRGTARGWGRAVPRAAPPSRERAAALLRASRPLQRIATVARWSVSVRALPPSPSRFQALRCGCGIRSSSAGSDLAPREALLPPEDCLPPTALADKGLVCIFLWEKIDSLQSIFCYGRIHLVVPLFGYKLGNWSTMLRIQSISICEFK